MANFINKYSDLAAYNADETKEFPNVSYLETEDEVKWQATEPIDQEHIVAVYNVTSTTAATKILSGTSNITYMIVDGVQQPSVTTGYTFSTTGEHTVKYKVNSNWNGYRTFENCRSLTSIIIPNSVTTIGESTFYYCTDLTSITIPDSVTSIGEWAFENCSNLTTITIPDSVTSIGRNAFNNCYILTSVNMPSGVTSIGNSAFNNCYNLTSITVNATTPPTLGTNVFYNTNNCPIYVPAASVNAYKTAANWSTYASRIQAIQ